MLLIVIKENPEIKTDSLLDFFDKKKPNFKTRIDYLCRQNLIAKLPKFNRGGNKNPNYYIVTNDGANLVNKMEWFDA